jgi:Leucine-rich repeat (LRR) protein
MTLDCNTNQLSDLDVSKNTALRWFRCYSNQLTNLDVSKNTALEELMCNSNSLTDLDISSNPALLSLSISHNLFSAASLNTLFENLPERKGYNIAYINIFGNPGAQESDRTIAVKKGWVVN